MVAGDLREASCVEIRNPCIHGLLVVGAGNTWIKSAEEDWHQEALRHQTIVANILLQAKLIAGSHMSDPRWIKPSAEMW